MLATVRRGPGRFNDAFAVRVINRSRLRDLFSLRAFYCRQLYDDVVHLSKAVIATPVFPDSPRPSDREIP